MQKKAARLTIDKVRKGTKVSKREIAREVGYAQSVADHPDKVFGTEGFKEEINALGFTEEFIKTALMEDIVGKPRRRARELELGAAILKMTEKAETGGNKTLIINITGENAQRFGILEDKTGIMSETNKGTSTDSTGSTQV